MTPDPLHLPVAGPFTCHASSGRGLFEQSEAAKPGVYLWTVRCETGFRVYYLGQTGRSFARHTKNTCSSISGRYRLWDTDSMRRGEKTLVWQGMWKTSVREELDEWLDRSPELVPQVIGFIKALEIFLIPWSEADRRSRERLEAALSRGISATLGINDVQDTDIRYRGRGGSEPERVALLVTDERILGMPEQITF